MIAKYGPVVKYEENGKAKFKSAKKDLDLDKLINSKYKKKDEIFWFTLETQEKNILCKHIHLSKFGHVCADHAF